MGDVIRSTAAVEDIFKDVRAALANASARGGAVKERTEQIIEPVVGMVGAIEAQLASATAVLVPLAAAVRCGGGARRMLEERARRLKWAFFAVLLAAGAATAGCGSGAPSSSGPASPTGSAESEPAGNDASAPSAADDPATSLQPGPIQATLTIQNPKLKDAADLQASVVITNTGSQPVRLSTLFFDFAPVMLSVRAAGGAPVRPGPPPVPPVDDGKAGRVELAPGRSITVDYRGSSYFAQPVAPGAYDLRFRYSNTVAGGGDWTGVIESEWVRFEITP